MEMDMAAFRAEGLSSIRKEAGIRPGQKFEVFRVGGIIEVVPVEDIKSACGSLPGLNTEVEREADDRV